MRDGSGGQLIGDLFESDEKGDGPHQVGEIRRREEWTKEDFGLSRTTVKIRFQAG